MTLIRSCRLAPRSIVVAAFIAIMAGAACTAKSPAALIAGMVNPAHDTLARRFLDSVRAGNFAYAERVAGPSSRNMPGLRDSIVTAVGNLPAGPIDSIQIVSVYRQTVRDVSTSYISYQIHTPQGWGLVGIRVNEELNLRFIDGFTGQRLPAPVDLSLSGLLGQSRNPITPFQIALCVLFGAALIFWIWRSRRTSHRRTAN